MVVHTVVQVWGFYCQALVPNPPQRDICSPQSPIRIPGDWAHVKSPAMSFLLGLNWTLLLVGTGTWTCQ